jgi:ADP-ribose pyrophosphatase YjhB (NUDIX family)
MDSLTPRWLDWAREVAALAQSGLHYVNNEFDQQRYARLAQIAAEIVAAHSNLSEADHQRLFFAQKGYATPKVDVRAAVFQGDDLLMVRERMDGGWTLPGGWADVGDVPSQAAERETFEEAGYHVRARRLVGVYDANRSGPLELYHAYKLIFLCELVGGESTPSNETSEVRFFSQAEIPQHLSGERTRPRHLQDIFALHADPGRPVVFD